MGKGEPVVARTPPLRFGLIGCGDFGKYLGAYIQEVAQVAALCDLDAGGMAATVDHLGLPDAPRFTDYGDLIASGRVDAVAVTAANFVHEEIAVAAAGAGLHVFCEKAMARSVPECWRMVRACRKAGVKLMVGHKRRLRPPWARMIELTAEDALGAVETVSVVQYADMRPYDVTGTWWADPALSGGHFAVLGVHVVDWLRAMCGDAVSVTAAAGPRHDDGFGFPDVLQATFRFASGAVASLSSAMHFPLHRFREAQGPWGQCRKGGFKLVPQMEHIDLYWQRLDEDEARHERFDDLGFDVAYRLEIGDFVRSVTEDRPPCLTWVEGLRCVELMEAAYRSAREGSRPVDLPLYPELEDPETT